ncbi:AtpZ/AtpI family protein [Kordiimonas sp.]|uniref:AtpZ/AtpI family protein n=1 Tax=Kordiimonas sp. TaxID=1970157 RepID=UPI003A924A92
MGNDDRDPELKSLEARLNQARQKRLWNDGADDAPSPMGRAFALGIHLVVGVVVGLMVGVNLDEWLGTTPFLLILFLLLGFGAGIRNVIRDAMRMQNEAMSAEEKVEPAKEADKD